MGNSRRINLLIRKNLRVRFSNRCLNFLELVIPLFLIALLGFSISFDNRERSFNRRKYYESSTEDTDVNPNFHEEEDFNWDWDYWYYKEEPTRAVQCWYLVNENVDSNLSQAIGNLLAKQSYDQYGVHWTKSLMSERDIEVCMAHGIANCSIGDGLVVFTQFEDHIIGKRITSFSYKIRQDIELAGYPDWWVPNTLILDRKNRQIMKDIDRVWSLYFHIQRFVYIQRAVDALLLEYLDLTYPNLKLHNINELTNITLKMMPYFDISIDFNWFYTVFVMSASLAVFSLMRVNIEKSSGFKELLRMHGVSVEIQWIAWWLSNVIVYGTWTLLITGLIGLPIGGGHNLLQEARVNPVVYWMLHFSLMMTVTTVCGCVSVFFEKSWTAASAGLIVWILLTVFSQGLYASLRPLTWFGSYALLLNPIVALEVGLQFLIGEQRWQGVWTTLVRKSAWKVPLPILSCLFMLLLDNVILMGLTIYLDNIIKSKHGVARSPLYFIGFFRNLIAELQRGRQPYSASNEDENNIDITDLNNPAFEEDPEFGDVCVYMENLKKQYKRGGPFSVNGLSTKIFTGEIYALLGFNGAGKTTTIGVLTGMTPPSSGTARIFDYDIQKNMESIRKHIGLCPQHNLLYDEMSIMDQVSFFAQLKGSSNPKQMASKLLNSLGLGDKLISRPKQLSGGQKRRAHLAIALIGNTKVAFLDEPTSALDPETRRGIWETICKLRGTTTVILTTHDMEEADFLGDRIGIMSDGKLVCNGTPSFLKKYYGVGYSLKMNTIGCIPQRLEDLARQFVPEAKLVDELSQVSHILTVSVPTHNLDMNKMADLMESFKEKQEDLSISDIGLSLSTMNDVFLKIGDMVHAGEVVESEANSVHPNISNERLVGLSLSWQRFQALVQKRMQYFLHAPVTLIIQVLIFGSLLWLSLYTMSTSALWKESIQVDIPLTVSDLSLYKVPTIVVENCPGDNLADAYMRQSRNEALSGIAITKEVNSGGISHFLMQSAFQNVESEDNMMLLGASFCGSNATTNKITGYFSPYAPHSASLFMNMIRRAQIQAEFQVDASINVISQPFQSNSRYRHFGGYSDTIFFGIVVGCTVLLVLIESLLVGVAILLPIEERLNLCKHLQLMTGTSPFLYWTGIFTWDFVFFTVVNISIVGVLVLVDYASGYWMFTCYNAGLVLFLILECFAFSALWFCYLLSLSTCLKTPSDGFLLVSKLTVMLGLLFCFIRPVLIHVIFKVDHIEWGERRRVNFFYILNLIMNKLIKSSEYFLWLFPMHTLFMSVIKLQSTSLPNSVCSWYPESFMELVCSEDTRHQDSESLYYKCCKSCQKNCFQLSPYLYWNDIKLFSAYTTHGLVFDIFGQLAGGILCAAILFFVEGFHRKRKELEELISMESVVLSESIQDSQASLGRESSDGLRIKNLSLKFGQLKAVDGISFNVHREECFGLLGVNGAGKTSTFRMITGDILPSSGTLYSGGFSLNRQRTKYLASIGYCPQFDGLIGALTGLQMVELFGSLRGIASVRVKEEAKIWLDRFGLLGSCDKKCSSYSGGMKRRLSTAIALIGNPEVILLDEPTTGVDPAFRRQFLHVMRNVQKGGQSVLLTSHSIDECEALCTRMAIMVDGKFKCSGNVQHLKYEHGQGYILKVRLKQVRQDEEVQCAHKIENLSRRIIEEFPSCRLQRKQLGLLEYQILDKTIWYSDVFRRMEEIRSSSEEADEVIQGYSVTETSLQDVFLSFVHHSTNSN